MIIINGFIMNKWSFKSHINNFDPSAAVSKVENFHPITRTSSLSSKFALWNQVYCRFGLYFCFSCILYTWIRLHSSYGDLAATKILFVNLGGGLITFFVVWSCVRTEHAANAKLAPAYWWNSLVRRSLHLAIHLR